MIKQGVPEKIIRVEVGSAADSIQNRPIFQKLVETELKENDLLLVTKIARATGKSRSTIYKILKNELNYVANKLIKRGKDESN